MTDRQSITVQIHIAEKYGPFTPRLHPATAEQPIASINVVDNLTIQTDEPAIFRRLADLLIEAAIGIDAALELKAGREANAANDEANREPFGTIPAPVRRITVTSGDAA